MWVGGGLDGWIRVGGWGTRWGTSVGGMGD